LSYALLCTAQDGVIDVIGDTKRENGSMQDDDKQFIVIENGKKKPPIF
jgi:hypothetical protein